VVILAGRSSEIVFFDRHRIDVIGLKRGVVEQAFAQMREIPIAVAWGRNTLVHLDDMNPIPGHVFVGKRTQHHPRRMPPAESSGELPRSAAAFRASAATIRAASRAALSGSAKTSIFMTASPSGWDFRELSPF
jgi:hypothetical protein